MFRTSVEGYVFYGTYYDHRTETHRNGLVVPVGAMIGEPPVLKPPGSSMSAPKLIVDELAMRYEKRANNRGVEAGSKTKGSSVVDLTGDSDNASNGRNSMGNGNISQFGGVPARSMLCNQQPATGVVDAVDGDVEMDDMGDSILPIQSEKRLPEGYSICDDVNGQGDGDNDVGTNDDRLQLKMLRSLIDDEAEEVNLSDEVEIRKDDLKYLNIAVSDDDNDEDDN